MSSFKEAKETVRSGERKHIIAGRTIKSPARGSATVEITPDDDDEDRKKRSAPKLDLNFSIKLGHQSVGLLKRSEQQNTGANVDGSFLLDSRAGGGYGNTTLPQEEELMTTPALPDGDEAGVEVSNVKISKIVNSVLRKVIASQLPLPTVGDETPGRSQPTGKPKTSPLGQNLGVLGGTIGGTQLGVALARQANLSGGAAMAPVVGGALGGAALGGLAGHKIQESLSAPEDEGTPEEQELQQLLLDMKEQNPEFYLGQAARAAPGAEDLQRKVAAVEGKVKEENRSGREAAGGFAGGIVAGQPLRAGARRVAQKGLLDVGGEVDTVQLLKKLKRQEAAAGLPRVPVASPGQSMYMPDVPGYLKKRMGRESIHLPDKANPFITAHEVGRASGGKIRKALMRQRVPH